MSTLVNSLQTMPPYFASRVCYTHNNLGQLPPNLLRNVADLKPSSVTISFLYSALALRFGSQTKVAYISRQELCTHSATSLVKKYHL